MNNESNPVNTSVKQYEVMCPSCNGKGYFYSFTTTTTSRAGVCPACKGNKSIIVTETTTAPLSNAVSITEPEPPVISAEEFLKEKGIAVDMNLNTCTKKPPKIKLTDLLNEYRNL